MSATTTKRRNEILRKYRRAAAALRRCLELGDIAAEYENGPRAAWHLIGMLDEIAPELRALRARGHA